VSPIASLAAGWRDYRQLDRRIWLLALARSINTAGLSLVMAFMALYLVTERGMSASAVGLVFLVANLLQAAAQAYAGDLSDRIGRVRLMTFVLWGRVVMVVTLGLLVLDDAPVAAIAAGVIASWTIRGGFEPVAFAVVADVADEGDRVAAFGLQRVGINLGWAAGPAVGGLLQVHMDYGWVFFCSAPVVAIAALAVMTVREPERRAESTTSQGNLVDALRALPGTPLVALFLATALLSGLSHGQLFSTFSIFAKGSAGLTEDAIGLLYTVNGALVLTLQLPAVAVANRLGPRSALVIGSALYAVAFLSIGGAGGFAGYAASIAVLTAGEVLLFPAQQATGAELREPGRMGRAMGLLGMAQMLGIAIALPLGGGVYDLTDGSAQPMWTALAAAPALMAALCGALAIKMRSGARTSSPPAT